MTVIPNGKLPTRLLEEVLAGQEAPPSVLLGSGIGRDAAVLDPGGDLIVAAADPITFAGERPAHYALQVNANDVAVMGARPAWFLATVLLPKGTTDDEVRELFADLRRSCAETGVSLVGGHTEVTSAAAHVVIAGTMLGVLAKGRLLDAGTVRAGDELWLAGPLAIEGTAILCREAADELRAAGVDEATIAAGARLLDDPGINIVAAALLL
ncbi:MAG: AIR synthase related protein, partial [Dehalococcoidia bacterium]